MVLNFFFFLTFTILNFRALCQIIPPPPPRPPTNWTVIVVLVVDGYRGFE